MLDFGKLADMSKLAAEAKQLQKKQEAFQEEVLLLLKKITRQLDTVIEALDKGSKV